MNFRSTRNQAKSDSISYAIRDGLASDGGLFVPESWPKLEIKAEWADLEFSRFAALVLRPFFQSDPLLNRLDDICIRAFDFPIPLIDLDQQTAALELFHGPTNAFKDFGARFLALCLNEIPASNSMPRMVLVATSGDTGGAVAAAFNELTKFPVAILYPSGRISPRQEKQLTVWGKQVHAFSVAGSFDDCQRVVKQAFASEWWRRHFQLISANSINLGRLLPQMACFAYASLRYQRQHGTDPGLIIPTGNAGNSAAGIWARKLGFPIRKVILAHNANQGVRDYFETGVWKSRPTVATLANAMDVAEPSNFERLLDLYPKLEDLKGVAEAFSIDDEQIRASIQQEWSSHQRVWCPHSAVAMRVRSLLQGGDWIVTATAHPAKFETILEPLLKMKIDVPAPLQTLLSRPSHSTSIQPDLPSLQAAISKTVRPQ